MNTAMNYLTTSELEQAYAESPSLYIRLLTDAYLKRIDGVLSEENMPLLSPSQHALLCYRFVLDEVSEGGWIQLIQNGYGPYVLEGPFPFTMKKEWGLKEFGKYLFAVKKEYHLHREALEAEMDEDTFMALYEQQETMNELGDTFLEEFEEDVTPQIAAFVHQHERTFNERIEK